MSKENVEFARQTYERFARGDFGSFTDFGEMTSSCVTSPDVPDAGAYSGEDARLWATAWVKSISEGLTMQAIEILDADDKVVVGIIQRGHFRGSRVATEGRWWNVLTFRNGEIIRSELYPERPRALAAAGLAPK